MKARFFTPELPVSGGPLELGAAASRHARVLRLGPGDNVELFDGDSGVASACVEMVHASSLRVIADSRQDRVAVTPPLHLVQVIPKARKLDDIIRMATELGVDSVHLALSKRSVGGTAEGRWASRMDRLSRVAEQASRQSQRSRIPSIAGPATLQEVTARATSRDSRLLFWEEKSNGVEVFLPQDPRSVWIVIGPEGGLDAQEVHPLVQEGWQLCGLGSTVLRVDTAAAAAVAIVQHHLRKAQVGKS